MGRRHLDIGRTRGSVGYETDRRLGRGMLEIWTEASLLYAPEVGPTLHVAYAPAVHIVRDLGRYLPFLRGPKAVPVICIADWEYEPRTQRYFWNQALPRVERACGWGR